jgi:hypothetical protein
MTQPRFTTSIAQSAAKIRRPVLASMFAVSVIIALVDVAFWAGGWKPWPTGLWIWGPEVLAISGAEYFGIIAILGLRPSLQAYIRFACTSALLLLPLLLAVAVLFATPIIGRTSALFAFGLGVLAGIAIIAFLPAWPVAQSVSSSAVTPLRVFRATRGFRWGLVGAAILLSVLSRQGFVPAVDKATDLSHAFAYAAGEAGMSTLSMIYTAAVAATAFIFVCRNDEDLYPPRGQLQSSETRRFLWFGA